MVDVFAQVKLETFLSSLSPTIASVYFACHVYAYLTAAHVLLFSEEASNVISV